MKEQIKKKVQEIKSDWTFKKEFSKSSHYQNVKIWENHGKFRVYVPKNAYEQAGYITTDSEDVSGYNSGEFGGLYFKATRPGNVHSLVSFIKDLNLKEVKQEALKMKKRINLSYEEARGFMALDPEGLKELEKLGKENYGNTAWLQVYVDEENKLAGHCWENPARDGIDEADDFDAVLEWAKEENLELVETEA